MALVQAGKQFNKDSIKAAAGSIATQMRDILHSATEFKKFLDASPDADLVTLGLTQEEVNAIKGFYIGEASGLKTSFDGFIWIKQLLGLRVNQ